ISSGNWRGYVATFALENAQLMLKKIETLGCGDREGGDIVPTLFDGKKEVFVDWFSGILVVPIGERVHYVHLGYGSLYSECLLFRIEAGRIIDETRMNAEQYDAYRQRQFEAHKQTSRYVQDMAEFMKDGQEDQDYADSFLYSVDTEYTTEIMLPFKAIPAP
ncbi:MAG: hypothetical protein KA144_15220, partial [Xanthomonadaceae bacterium]|nr:hypothetical protein [Xanthomonadaceae bacterium]